MTSVLSVTAHQPPYGASNQPSPSSPKQVHAPKKSRGGVSLRSLSRTNLSCPSPTFLTKAKLGLISHSPELCPDGTGGTYFMKSAHGVPIAVFKPVDEDPLSQFNPKRKEDDPPFHFRGLRPGESIQREIFAYQIDQGFAGVPETHEAEVSHWVFTSSEGAAGPHIKRKRGSIQEFVSDVQCDVDDMGCSKFSLQDVQRIAVLDLLLANCDRNGGNILVQRNTCKLVPIDHGFCLPDFAYLNDMQWFEWLTWRQSKAEVLPEVLAFVDQFDVDEAARKARALGIREECIMTLHLCYTFVRESLHSGRSLCETGKLMCSFGQSPSVLEKLVEKAYNATLHPGAALADRFAQQVALYFM